jgi:hypothetical protein
VNVLRPTLTPQTPGATPVQRADPAGVAAQRAFFDLVSGKSAPTPPIAAARTAATEFAPAAVPPQRVVQAGAEPPAKILRPGSLLDIRV